MPFQRASGSDSSAMGGVGVSAASWAGDTAPSHHSVASDLLELGKRTISQSMLTEYDYSASGGSLSSQNSTSSLSSSGTAKTDSLSAEEKKRLKRAANRRSAQLSRQRKKKYIEELTVEYTKLKQVTEILAAMSDIVLMVGSSGEIIFASEAAHRVLQFSRESFIGRSIYSLVTEDSRQQLKEALKSAADEYRRQNAKPIAGGEERKSSAEDANDEVDRGGVESMEEEKHEPAIIPRCTIKFKRHDGVIVKCDLSGSVTRMGSQAQLSEDESSQVAGTAPSTCSSSLATASASATATSAGSLRFVCSARPQAQPGSGRSVSSRDGSLMSSSGTSDYSLSNSGASGSSSGGTDSDNGSISGSAMGSDEGVDSAADS